MTRFCGILFLLLPFLAQGQKIESFNDSWEFARDIDSIFIGGLLGKNAEVKWERISLPHTAHFEPVQKISQQWQGTCFYRKYWRVDAGNRGKHVAIRFDAAMQVADVYINGKHIYKHLGGYLPFYVDVSNDLLFGEENSILIKLNNEDNPIVPPGKPLKELDFNYYSGIYRNVWIITKDKLRISDAVAANRTAGGGVYVHVRDLNASKANISVKTDVINDYNFDKHGQIRLTLFDVKGQKVIESLSASQTAKANEVTSFEQALEVSNPATWSPDSPNLYDLRVELTQGENVLDSQSVKVGLKTIRLDREGLYVNDRKILIRGTNRHQEYPYLGNAGSDEAQYRDAYKIKLAGFNFVRTSHYPQSPAFLNACDELGIMVMDAIPGWQFVGNDDFKKNSFQNIRDMIHRDRNHPSVVLWEASLNESFMKKDYMQKAHEIVHEELPFSDTYSAGWMNDSYDVFLPARQHGKAPDYWKKYDKKTPLLIAEYGDWEYYAQNAGFNQPSFSGLKEEERTSRQLRRHGEKRLLQQALNYQEAHNDNLYNPALGDVNWLIFDYNRGYADDIESSGIMDIFRLPKFAFYFFQSQVDPVPDSGTPFNKPIIFIANYWQKESATQVKIYSNCEEVELFLNGKSIGKQHPDADPFSTKLKHAPTTFDLKSFKPGTLRATGYIHGKKVIEQVRQTPEVAASIQLRVDYSGKNLRAGKNDFVFVYAEVVDRHKTIVPDFSGIIVFKVEGDATVVGPTSVQAEAGIATLVLRAGSSAGTIRISTKSGSLVSGELIVESK